MRAQRDQGPPTSSYENHPIPPWASSFDSASSLSAAASTASPSASGDDSNNDSNTSSELAGSSGNSSPTTFTTSVALGSSTIDLSTSSASMAFQTSDMSRQPPPSEYLPTYSNGGSFPAPSSIFEYTTTLSWPTPASDLSQTSSLARLPVATSSSTAAEPTDLPNNEPATNDRHSFNGAVLAAIIVPIMVLLFLGIALLLCLRRRRRVQGVPFRPIAEAKEKMFAKRSSSTATSIQIRQVAPPQPHIIMSPENNTYFTGLETMSMMSAEPQRPSHDDPPPPYRARSQATNRSVSVRSAVSSLTAPPPVLFSPVSPISPLDSRDVAEVSPFDDPPAGPRRTPSARSITSTLYSSNASVVEARPARRSVGGPNMIGMDERSPFADPDSESDDR